MRRPIQQKRTSCNLEHLGTCLLRPRGASGNLFEGTWQGYTAPDFQDDPAFAQGRVVMARNRETVVAHWGLVPADGGAP